MRYSRCDRKQPDKVTKVTDVPWICQLSQNMWLLSLQDLKIHVLSVRMLNIQFELVYKPALKIIVIFQHNIVLGKIQDHCTSNTCSWFNQNMSEQPEMITKPQVPEITINHKPSKYEYGIFSWFLKSKLKQENLSRSLISQNFLFQFMGLQRVFGHFKWFYHGGEIHH